MAANPGLERTQKMTKAYKEAKEKNTNPKTLPKEVVKAAGLLGVKTTEAEATELINKKAAKESMRSELEGLDTLKVIVKEFLSTMKEADERCTPALAKHLVGVHSSGGTAKGGRRLINVLAKVDSADAIDAAIAAMQARKKELAAAE